MTAPTVTIDDPLAGGSDPGAWLDALRWLAPFLSERPSVSQPLASPNGGEGHCGGSLHDDEVS